MVEDVRIILNTVVANLYTLSKNKYIIQNKVYVEDLWKETETLYDVLKYILNYSLDIYYTLEPLPQIKFLDNTEIEKERQIRNQIRDKVRIIKAFLQQLSKQKPEYGFKSIFYGGDSIQGVATYSDVLIYIGDMFSKFI